MILKKFRLSLIVLLISISGCSPLSFETKTIIPTVGDIPQNILVTPSNTPIDNAESTIIPALETTAVPALTPTVTQRLPFEPIEIKNDAPTCSLISSNQNLEFPGTILYLDNENSRLSVTTDQEHKAGKKMIQAEQQLFSFGLSPDGNWTAFSPEPKDSLEKTNPVIILVGADGTKEEHTLDMTWLKKMDEPEYELVKFVDGHWFNDHLIFAYIVSGIPEEPNPLRSPQIGSYLPILFDPFTGEVQTTLLDQFMPTNGQTAFAISPDLKHILIYEYFGSIRLLELNETGSFSTLWETNHSLANAFIPVTWSPNGEWVIFSAYDGPDSSTIKTIILTKDGKAREFDNPIFDGWPITQLYWSPNSRYFTFLAYKDETSSDLFVVDGIDNHFILSCPLVRQSLHSIDHLTWSPDSTWIAVTIHNEPVQIINIHTSQISQLNINGSVVGWSEEFVVTP